MAKGSPVKYFTGRINADDQSENSTKTIAFGRTTAVTLFYFDENSENQKV